MESDQGTANKISGPTFLYKKAKQYYRESLDLSQLTEETIELMMSSVREKSIHLVSHINKNTLAQADKRMVETILRNLVLLDYKLSGMRGEELFIKIKEINPTVPVIFMTVLQSVDNAVRLLKMGAFTYLGKPLQMEELFHNITNALEKAALVKDP